MADKCFCHLNGFEVKDAQARKDLKELEDVVINNQGNISGILEENENLSERVTMLESKPNTAKVGLIEGDSVSYLRFNTKISFNEMKAFLEDLVYDEKVPNADVDGFSTALYKHDVEGETRIGVYAINFNKVGGNGYGIAITSTDNDGNFMLLQPIFASEYSQANLAIMQQWLPDCTYSEAGWYNVNDFTFNSPIIMTDVVPVNKKYEYFVSAFIGTDNNKIPDTVLMFSDDSSSGELNSYYYTCTPSNYESVQNMHFILDNAKFIRRIWVNSKNDNNPNTLLFNHSSTKINGSSAIIEFYNIFTDAVGNDCTISIRGIIADSGNSTTSTYGKNINTHLDLVSGTTSISTVENDNTLPEYIQIEYYHTRSIV